MSDLFDIFESLERESAPRLEDKIFRSPFKYPGAKFRSVKQIIKHLPYKDRYVEPFGGSGVILLNRHKVKFEVLNDRYSGAVPFYLCLQDNCKLQQLIELIEMSIHAREFFVYCKENWKRTNDDVARAFMWYYTIETSFGAIGRSWGRSTASSMKISRIREKIKYFWDINERLKGVQIENQDWYYCMLDYDNDDTVFYLDPPYVDADKSIYSDTGYDIVEQFDWQKFIETIFKMSGFVALSGYANPLFDNLNWDERHTWESFVSIQSTVESEGNKKAHLQNVNEQSHAEEVLWIKY